MSLAGKILLIALKTTAARTTQWGKTTDTDPTKAATRTATIATHITKGAIQTSFKNTKPIQECLADELILASKNDMNSFAVTKKEEVERVASSAR